MRLSWDTATLALRTTFATAHGASDTRENVVVRLEHGGAVGLGEAAGLHYHGESLAGIEACLVQAAAVLRRLALDDLDAVLDRLPPGSAAARAAVDMALHDLWGQARGEPLYRLFGLDPRRAPSTSFTVGLDAPDRMGQRAREAAMPILKLKVGGPGRRDDDDEAALAAVRAAAPDAAIRIDANAGWSRDRAARLIARLARYGIELVEQPLPVDDIEGLRWLGGRVDVPVFADESARTADDVTRLRGAVDGVVVKLMKCGGLRAARAVIAAARREGMSVMLSCMIESSLAVTAAAHLAPLCDLVDLDGPLLIRDDPFRGLGYDGARLQLPEGPGLGVAERRAGQLLSSPHSIV
jgi:L-alanine-DL-glutamate epimerase-like enolase superfamily enzyme